MSADTRLNLVMQDITEGVRHEKARDACIDDARTHLANIVEERPANDLALALIGRAARDLDAGCYISAQANIIRASEALENG